jgi:hypothetical protein
MLRSSSEVYECHLLSGSGYCLNFEFSKISRCNAFFEGDMLNNFEGDPYNEDFADITFGESTPQTLCE